MAMRRAACFLVLVVVAWTAASVKGDTTANCTYEDIEGLWAFSTSDLYGSYDELVQKEDCSNFVAAKLVNINLRYPDMATDELGNFGFWTLIYNQGFEVVIANRKYFAFSRYQGDVSICSSTMPSFTHDVLQRQWACFSGQKHSQGRQGAAKVGRKAHFHYAPALPTFGGANSEQRSSNALYVANPSFVDQINAVQNSWRATLYPEYVGQRIADLSRRSGVPAAKISRPRSAPVTPALRQLTAALPESFDWRNVGGQSFVAPVRNQGGCGSCYSFASTALLETRIRIASNNSLQPILSPQDVVECSFYSQGCGGGFPYLVAGKYGEDFGFVEESCNPYTGQEGACSTSSSCTRYYSTAYRYVGGYYGACNEEWMKLTLVEEGPLAVSFEVYPDFQNYKGGVYEHTGLADRFNPFEITNHVVLVVGYGTDQATGTKFWSVKNSWSDSWGENGYFRIRRGTDECGIESLVVTVQAVL